MNIQVLEGAHLQSADHGYLLKLKWQKLRHPNCNAPSICPIIARVELDGQLIFLFNKFQRKTPNSKPLQTL